VLLWGRWRLLPKAALGAVLAGVLLLPLYLMHRRAADQESFTRGTEETVHGSAPLEAFLATSRANWIYGGVADAFRTIGPNNLFPGLVIPSLVIAAAAVRWRRGERPGREAVALAVMAAVAGLAALGPEIRAFGRELGPGPWALLRNTVPAFQMLRVPSRAGIFIALPLAMLAAMGLTVLRPRPVVGAMVGTLALAETLIVPIHMPEWTQIVDTRREPPPVYRWLASQPGRDVIVHLPIWDDRAMERRPAFHETIYMVYSTLHWQPMVNGWAGFEPRGYARIRAEMIEFPSEGFLDLLREVDVRYIVVHRAGYGPNQWRRYQAQMAHLRPGSLREVVTLEGDTVYELQPRAGGHPSTSNHL
jgi:hypothetical protein